MDFSVPRKPRRTEAIIPMINIVFLLLIFFMLTATLAPPDPFETVAPSAAGGERADPADLFLAPDGRIAYGAAEGETVFAAVAEHVGPLVIRADAGAEAAKVAALLSRLRGLGLDDLRLEVIGR